MPDDGMEYLHEASLSCSYCGEHASSALHLCAVQPASSDDEVCLNFCDACLGAIAKIHRVALRGDA